LKNTDQGECQKMIHKQRIQHSPKAYPPDDMSDLFKPLEYTCRSQH